MILSHCSSTHRPLSSYLYFPLTASRLNLLPSLNFSHPFLFRIRARPEFLTSEAVQDEKGTGKKLSLCHFLLHCTSNIYVFVSSWWCVKVKQNFCGLLFWEYNSGCESHFHIQTFVIGSSKIAKQKGRILEMIVKNGNKRGSESSVWTAEAYVEIRCLRLQHWMLPICLFIYLPLVHSWTRGKKSGLPCCSHVRLFQRTMKVAQNIVGPPHTQRHFHQKMQTKGLSASSRPQPTSHTPFFIPLPFWWRLQHIHSNTTKLRNSFSSRKLLHC